MEIRVERKPESELERAAVVERVLASQTFSGARWPASFLRYVTRLTAEGRTDEIKEYSIAVDVFRCADYDSKTHSRVRTEARKLRALLEKYYAGEGVDDSIRIEIPTGGYVPSFTARADSLEPGAMRPAMNRVLDWFGMKPPGLALAAAGLLAATTLFGWWRWHSDDGRLSDQGGAPSVAVLPFVDLSPGHSRQPFCDGLTEELIGALSRIEGLRIPSRTSVFQYRNQSRDVRRIGQELGVHAVLEGSVQATADKLSVNFRLVNSRDGFHLWSETFHPKAGSEADMQSDLAEQIENRFRFYLVGATKGLPRPGTRKAEAWHYYLLAAQAHTSSEPEKAVNFFQAALTVDPGYARAMAGLSISLLTLADWLTPQPKQLLDRAYPMAIRAASLGPQLADSQQALGLVKVFVERDWAGADQAFRRAIEIDPTDSWLRIQYARMVLAPLKRFAEEERQLNQAQVLEPKQQASINRLAHLRMRTGDFDAAIPLLQKSLRLQPKPATAYLHLGQIALLRGNPAEAMRWFEEGHSRQQSQWTIGNRGAAFAALGNRAEAERLIGSLWSRYEIACIYTALGDRDKAFAALDAAVDQHEVQTIWMTVEPRLKTLYPDSRFAALAGKLGLRI